MTVGRRSEVQLEPSCCRGQGGGEKGEGEEAVAALWEGHAAPATRATAVRARDEEAGPHRAPKLLHPEGSLGLPGSDIGNNGGSGLDAKARALESEGD